MFNYRLSYRLAIASAGKNTYNQMHGSSIVRTKQIKTDEITIQQLLEDSDGCAFMCNMWNNNFFIHPPELLESLDAIHRNIYSLERLPFLDGFKKSPLKSVVVQGEKFSLINSINEVKEFEMSLRTKAKIKDKMYSLYRARMRSYCFCTLSFINKVSDENAVKVLNKFFTQLRKKFKSFHYLWVAERQDGKRNDYEHCTGNVHFHIFFDRFLPISKLNAYWILMQYNSGIVHDKYSLEEIQKMYAEGALKNALNPVDVKHVKGLSGLTSYMTKYVTKNKTTFGCRVWHCSRGISRLFTSSACNRSVFKSAGCCSLNRVIDKTTGEVFEAKTFVDQYSIVHTIVNKRHFHTYLNSMEIINSRILDGENFKHEDFKLDFLTSLQVSLN